MIRYTKPDGFQNQRGQRAAISNKNMKRVVKVNIYNKDGSYCSSLTLDTSKYDDIGSTDETLNKYMKKWILTEGRYFVKSSDKFYGPKNRRVGY